MPGERPTGTFALAFVLNSVDPLVIDPVNSPVLEGYLGMDG